MLSVEKINLLITFEFFNLKNNRHIWFILLIFNRNLFFVLRRSFMTNEEWLISEVDKWQDENIVDREVGEKIKSKYEIYKPFNFNIFAILLAILGGVLIVSGIGLITFYNWKTLSAIGKIAVAVSPLIISYIISFFTILFKYDNRIWKEASAFLNVSSMFLALALIVNGFHFSMSLSDYLIICSLLALPVIYIMQAVFPLILYYIAILMWGSINMSFTTALILFCLFMLGTVLIFINIKKFNKILKHNLIISALAGLPFMVLIVKMLNGDAILATFLYSTILFAARDIKKSYLPFRQISVVVSLLAIIYVTTSHAWTIYEGNFGGITLGIVTGLTLLASLALEVFNTKDNNYEFSYLLVLMALSIVRYIGGCLHVGSFIMQMVFMGLSVLVAMLVAFGFVSLGKSQKKLVISTIGFVIIGIILLIKIFETNLFFLGRAVAFLVLGSVSLILVIFVSGSKNGADEKESVEVNTNEKIDINN